MKYRTLGSSGLRVSRLGLGTLNWGLRTNADEAAGLVTAFLDAGGTFVDNSPAYADGVSQDILAGLLKNHVNRESLVLASGSGIHPMIHPRVDCSRRALLAQLDDTLRVLGVDHLDLWQVDAWDPHTPVEEVAQTLAHAVRRGSVRYIGVRGFTGWQLATLAARCAEFPIVSSGVEYSLLAREAESQLLPCAKHHGVGAIAATPLAEGVLTGKYRKGMPKDSRAADPTAAVSVERFRTETANRIVDSVLTAADGLATSPLAVALAWVRDRLGVSSVLIGARDVAQLTGALAAEELTLPKSIAVALDDVSGAHA
ncbi:aldo/keto reductase [Segniliparus rotundus DSM 44985]|uniref:Aldo/keto reductase n=1 Tax=Segniliparus rotundus (strain ATCC BAA-972 / CDC 1076 / CIP 108378 / DSM 44985 / JCM 13578) TaxID=640132 RepID=D6ZFF9_SEGRD|nr:aldo/keto reductase [Segniliparus rotundus]ADG97683.1 aldo/keto reductase [Segniliparus rotundus DSM 44985]